MKKLYFLERRRGSDNRNDAAILPAKTAYPSSPVETPINIAHFVNV